MGIVTIGEAIKQLRQSQVVALPTETVYGLAAPISNEVALKSIFTKKSRPFFDPLIVHVLDINQAKDVAEIDEVSQKLAEHFWPGPLTLVVKKKEGLSDLITNGGPSVALRSPDHSLFRTALKKLGEPLAAPSANRFGKTSPTTANHVLDDFDGDIVVVDGGPCNNGIESTIVEVNNFKKTILILRPGIFDIETLKSVLQKEKIDFDIKFKETPNMPGQLLNHYQPEVPLVLIKNSTNPTLSDDMKKSLLEVSSSLWKELKFGNDPSVAARTLYGHLRGFSKDHCPIYIFYNDDHFSKPQWHGLADRIIKASSASLIQRSGSWTLLPKT